MAAVKNPHNDLVCVHSNYKDYNGGMITPDPCKKEYLIILKGRVFACKATSRTNAIDIASISSEFGELMDHESLSHGRPLNKYQIPNMEVIRVRPYHRGWAMNTNENKGDNDYMYVSLMNGRPTVYKGGSMVLDYASSKGMIHKVRVHDYENLGERELIV